MSPLFGPSADAVLAQGTPAQGTVIGIRITYTHDDSPTRLDEYAVSAGSAVYGIRQQLSPESSVRLGMSVGLRIDGKAAVIEWGDLITQYWKTLSRVPSPGIEDDSDGLGTARRKWTPATITLGTITERSVMMGMGSVHDVDVVVAPPEAPPYETVLKNVQPAHYAAHLFAAGAVLSGWVNPSRLDKVLIDWAAAAVANPGVGAASAVPAKTGGLFDSVSASGPASGPADAPSVELPGFMTKLGFTSNSPDEVVDSVSWEQFIAVFKATGSGAVRGAEAETIAVRHGIPAGEWDAAQARWMTRISKDMKLGIAFGQALGA